MKKFDLIALGETLIDFTPAPGERTFTANPGGAPANLLVSAAKCGVSAAFIGKVGKDQFGSFLKETLRTNDVDVSMVPESDVHTTLAFVHLTENGDRSFSFCRNHSADTLLSIEDLDVEAIRACKVFHVGSLSLTDSPSREATLFALKTAKEAGVRISYDPNWRPALWNDLTYARESMALPLEYADVIKLSDNEVSMVTPYDSIEDGMKWLLQKGIGLVVVTMGEHGCRYLTGDEEGSIPAPSVHPVDTTGAGDAFTGALLSRLIRENFSMEHLEENIRFAVTAGSLCTTGFGGIPSICTEQQIRKFMEKGE